ncbi:hypothetical protein DEO72_LG5g1197 [Vigna unguiculata]|uniref:Uncharacterized protein n=1 Tax=Vigna unguiculata TaxID=3917 RepID=A0A4D6LYT1_VIGUN|nr:hypothetical protein DEO72_LG5g1197 [Vigna unguiculata]
MRLRLVVASEDAQVRASGVRRETVRKMVAQGAEMVEVGCVKKMALLFVVAGRREGAVEMEVEVSDELQWWPARRWRRRLPWWVEGKLGLGFHV